MTEEKTKYFVVKQKAVPEVLLKVVEAKKLLESEQVMTVQEAAERVGISRRSFYKYKDDILPFYANILTIHQSIPVNGVATLTLSVEVKADTGNISQMVEEMEEQQGIHYVKILARE